MIKKVLSIAVLLCLLAGSINVSAVPTEGTLGDNVTWKYEDGTLTVSGIGAMERAHPYPWDEYHDSTTKLIVESGITSISSGAFSGFGVLTSVSLADTVTTIGHSAFSGCSMLSELPLTEFITALESNAFSSCSGVKSLTIPSSLTAISRGAFSGCRSLTSVTIPNSVTIIDTDAFSGCNKLTSITIPDSVTDIGSGAFSSCPKLTDVKLSSNLRKLENSVFSLCYSLTEITVPDTVTDIANYAFSNCKALQSVYLGASVSSVSAYAFRGCGVLKAFVVSPDNPYLTTDNGFIYSKSPTELIVGPQGYQGRLTILPGTTKINHNACYGCAGITEVIFPDSVTAIEEYAFDDCSGIRSVSLSNSLRTIGGSAFDRCSSLTEITFPASLTRIDQLAFIWCESLEKIMFTGMAPKIASKAFGDVRADAYYPKNKPGWEETKEGYGGFLHWYPLEDICKDSHTPTAIPAVSPTCTAPGSKDGIACSVCGTVLTQPTAVPATGHTFTQWQTVENPTEAKPGFEKRTCAVCGHWQSRDVYMDKTQQTPTEPPETEPAVTEPTGTETVVTEPEESTAAPESTATENLASSPTMPVDTASGNEKNSIRTWVVGISATIVLVAAIAATIVGSIQKKKE